MFLCPKCLAESATKAVEKYTRQAKKRQFKNALKLFKSGAVSAEQILKYAGLK